jgi:hypothetical protein
VFGFEYAILMTIVANTVVKYVLHSVDLYSEAPWENKAVFMLYTELFIGLIKVFLVTPVPTVFSRGCGFGSGSGALMTPGSGMGKKSRFGMNIPDHCSESLETGFHV